MNKYKARLSSFKNQANCNMEAAALPLAIFHTFHNVVDDIHLLHAFKDSNNNFKTQSARLANIQTQLSRWGKAVGLIVDNIEEAQFEKLIPKEDQPKAKNSLEQMQILLQDARRLSVHYEKQSKTEVAATQDHSSSDGDMEALTERTRKFSITRLAKSYKMTLMDKTRWALYDQAIFEKLLDDMSKLMADLEMLFPSNRPEIKRLAREELDELEEQIVRAVVENMGSQKDDALQEALRGGRKASQSIVNTTFGDNNSGVQVGRDSHGNTFNMQGRS